MSRYDGKASVEHQLDIHVNDLLQQDPQQPHLPSLLDILHGLQYVMDYRIRGGRMPNLSADLCSRLTKALVLLSGHRNHRSLLERVRGVEGGRMAEEAGLAFSLLLDFLREQPACLVTIREMPIDEVRRRLCLKIRLEHDETREPAMRMLKILSSVLDVRELVDAEVTPIFEADHSPTMKTLMPPQGLFFDRDVDRVLDMFRVRIGAGLSGEEVSQRSHFYGPNKLCQVQRKAIWRLILNQMADFMMAVLLVACIGSAIIDWPNPTSAIVLLVVILMNVTIGTVQEWRSEQTLAHLKSMTLPTAKVWRDGEVQTVSADQLVPGDLVPLSEGDAIAADLRLLQCNQLYLVEAALTGESEPIAKQPTAIKGIKSRRIPLTACTGNAFAGTQVAKGSGLGMVVRIGGATELGKIQQALGDSALNPQASQLTRRLQRLGMLLVALSFALCLLVLAAGLAWKQPLLSMVRIAVSLAVSVIPEGLVAVVTVTMALGVGRLARQQAVVRQLPAVEALGAITVICTDKTGTLTEGRMRVEEHLEEGDLLAHCAALCSDVTWDSQREAWQGDTTEQALMQWAMAKVSRDQLPSRLDRKVEIPFDSDRKMMTVGYECPTWIPPSLQGQVIIWVKGAPERILERCDRWWNGQEAVAMDEVIVARLSGIEGDWSDQGLRVLFMAVRPITLETTDLETNLIMIGAIGLIDPPRPGVREAIEQAHQAGIQVCMITGDHLRTACSIARRLGILNAANQRAIRGDELDLLSEEALQEMHPFPVVMARVSPSHKLAIVKALQARGEQVLMTGDGVNDAPAIKRANVGVAMGLNGTELSKDAADVVLLDDNFCTIIRAIGGGRHIYANIGKFIVYLLACNSAEIWTVLLPVLLNRPAPFTPLMILWANIIADVPPSLSLGLEAPEGDLMRHPPRPTNEPIVTKWRWFLIIVEGIILATITLIPYLLITEDQETSQSEAFFTLTTLQLVLALLSRSLHASLFHLPPLGNPYLLAACLLSFALLCFSIYTPGVNSLLSLLPLGPWSWLRMFIGMIILLISTEMLKLFIRFRMPAIEEEDEEEKV